MEEEKKEREDQEELTYVFLSQRTNQAPILH